MHIRRQAECGFRFLLELQVQRRQSRAEAERSRATLRLVLFAVVILLQPTLGKG